MKARWLALVFPVLLLTAVACTSSEAATATGNEVVAAAGESAHDDGDDHAAGGDDEIDGHDGAAENAYLEASPKDQLLFLRMTSFAYDPAVIEVTAGEVIEIVVQNVALEGQPAIAHDFTIEAIDADVHISYLGGAGQHAHAEGEIEADVHFVLTEAGSGIVHLKIHDPGEYVFYCTIPGHREAGMVGTLIVTPGSGDHGGQSDAADAEDHH